MSERDFYKILGVARSASESEIRKAYKHLARKYHPDKNPGNKAAEERFKEAGQASDVLLNRRKRELYDEFGEVGLREGFNPDAFRQYRGHGGAGAGAHVNLEDLFEGLRQGRGGKFGGFQDFAGGNVVEQLFGRAARGQPQAAAREVVSDVQLGFLEALRGGERELLMAVQGEPTPRAIKLRIPPGVRDGGQMRLRGQGPHGADVVLRIHVGDHPLLRREGDDLLLTLPITVGEAYRGARVSVPTLAGDVALTIPKGVKSGAKLRLRGKGAPRGDEAGDLIVTVQVRLPEEDDSVGRLVDELEGKYRENVRAGLKL